MEIGNVQFGDLHIGDTVVPCVDGTYETDLLISAGERMLADDDRLGEMEWDGRPLSNLEMHAMTLATLYGESAICARWSTQLIDWLSTQTENT